DQLSALRADANLTKIHRFRVRVNERGAQTGSPSPALFERFQFSFFHSSFHSLSDRPLRLTSARPKRVNAPTQRDAHNAYGARNRHDYQYTRRPHLVLSVAITASG